MTDASQPDGFYDFFGPFMSAAIVTTNKGKILDRYPLWTGPISDAAKKNVGLKGSINHLCFLNQLTIDNGLGNVPRITAQLTPTYEDGIAFLNSDLIIWGKNYLEVEFGYVGLNGKVYSSEKHSGLILQPDVKIGASIEITLIAQGLGAFGMTREEGAADYKNMSIKQILAAIVRGPVSIAKGLSPVVDDTAISKGFSTKTTDPAKLKELKDLSDATQKTYNRPLSSFTRTGKTDFQLLSELLALVSCTFSFVPVRPTERNHTKFGTNGHPIREKLVIHLKPTLFLKDPTINLTMYNFSGELGPRVNTYPIISASSPHVGVFAPSETKAMLIKGIDAQTKERIEAAYTASEEEIAAQKKKQDNKDKRKGAKNKKPNVKPKQAKQVKVGRSSKAPVDYTDPAVIATMSRGANLIPKEAVGAAFGPDDEVTAYQKKASSVFKSATLRTNSVFPGDPSLPDLESRVKNEISEQALNMGVKLIIETLGVPNIKPGDTVKVTGLSTRYDTAYSIFNMQHVLSPSGFTTRLEMYSNAAKLLESTGRFDSNLPANPGNNAPKSSTNQVANATPTRT